MKKLLILLLAISIPNFSLALDTASDDPREEIIVIDAKDAEAITNDITDNINIEQLEKEIKSLQEVGKQINSLNQKEQKGNHQAFLSSFASRVKSVFNWTAANIDRITTKRGMISTLLLLGPLFTVYCYFFPSEPIKALIAYIFSIFTNKELIEKVSEEGAKAMATGAAAAGKGAAIGFWEGFKENWVIVSSLALGLKVIPLAIKVALVRAGVDARFL